MNKQEIISVLRELNRISGFRVSLHGANYEEIAAYPEESLRFCREIKKHGNHLARCIECDSQACDAALRFKGTYIYKCHCGITEAVSPLYNFGTLTGFLMMGQVADSDNAVRKASYALLSATCDPALTKEIIADIPRVDGDMVESYVNVMTICARYLTLSNAIPSRKPTVAELAKKYIGDNISRKISISDICDYLKCSKSTLLTTFKRQYGITVNSYITEVRLGIAVRLLGEGELTISEIAAETGFSDQSYFSKVFSAKYGIPPSEYRVGTRSD